MAVTCNLQIHAIFETIYITKEKFNPKFPTYN